MMLLLLVPYVLFPLMTASALRACGWHENVRITVPLAMGTGPFLFAWLMEVVTWAQPGMSPESGHTAMLMLGLGAVIAIALLEKSQRPFRWLVREFNPTPVFALATVAVLLLLASGPLILFTWDPQAYRMIADRIVLEGVVSPATLIHQPTINDLIFVHAFHGLRYLMLLSANRWAAFPEVTTAGWDGFPALWFLVAAIALLGGLVSDNSGWRRLAPWLAAALLLSSYDFLLWPLAGKAAGSFSAFACLALFCCALRLSRYAQSDSPQITGWVVMGVTLGLCIGAHRTIILLAAVPAFFALAACIFSQTLKPMAGAIIAGIISLVLFCPFGYDLLLNVGGLESANTVSDQLVPYRATFREAFEGNPWLLGVVQFTSVSNGGLIWWGAVIGLLYLVASRHRERLALKRENAFNWAFVLSLGLLTMLVTDMAQVFRLTGFSELILRSTKYRQMVAPMMVWTAVFALSSAIPWRPTGSSRLTGVGTLAVTCLGFTLVLGSAYSALKPRLPSNFNAVKLKYLDTYHRTDYQLIDRFTRGDVEHIVPWVNQRCDAGMRIYVDWMPLVPALQCAVSNPWSKPGLFPLLDAEDPHEAWLVASALDLRFMVMRSARAGMELFSTTGIRHYQSVENTALIVDGEKLQLFALRQTPQVAIEYTAPELMAEETKYGDISVNQEPLELFAQPLSRPGDYELSAEFSSEGGTLAFREYRNGKPARRFPLKSFRPYSPGPQRFRFKVAPGETVNFAMRSLSADHAIAVRSIKLLTTP